MMILNVSLYYSHYLMFTISNLIKKHLRLLQPLSSLTSVLIVMKKNRDKRAQLLGRCMSVEPILFIRQLSKDYSDGIRNSELGNNRRLVIIV
jgi:hypothetical protein